jgi:hypothetical protein
VPDIRTIADVAEAARQTCDRFRILDVWWRGPARGWPIVPGAHREGRTELQERNVALRFRNRASIRYPDAPAWEDLPGWLSLMQHYRAPTRLLDWTGSILAATFFAVGGLEEHGEHAGVVWGLHGAGLNGTQEVRGLPSLYGGWSNTLVQRAFHENLPPARKTLAVIARETDVRMMVQLAAFTIHDAGMPPLEAMPGQETFLVRFDIPAEVKYDLAMDLFRLGVRRSTLFPDLEGLAAELSRMGFGEQPPRQEPGSVQQASEGGGAGEA